MEGTKIWDEKDNVELMEILATGRGSHKTAADKFGFPVDFIRKKAAYIIANKCTPTDMHALCQTYGIFLSSVKHAKRELIIAATPNNTELRDGLLTEYSIRPKRQSDVIRKKRTPNHIGDDKAIYIAGMLNVIKTAVEKIEEAFKQ